MNIPCLSDRSPVLSAAAATTANAPTCAPEPALPAVKPAADPEQAEVSRAFLAAVVAPRGPAAVAKQAGGSTAFPAFVEAPPKLAAVATQTDFPSARTVSADVAAEAAPANPTPSALLMLESSPAAVLVAPAPPAVLVEEPVAATTAERLVTAPVAVAVTDVVTSVTDTKDCVSKDTVTDTDLATAAPVTAQPERDSDAVQLKVLPSQARTTPLARV